MAVAQRVLGGSRPTSSSRSGSFGADAIRADGRLAPARDARGVPLGGRRPEGADRASRVRRRRRPTRAGHARLRAELDVYANLRPARAGRDRPRSSCASSSAGSTSAREGCATTAPSSTRASTTPSQVERIARRAASSSPARARGKLDVGRQGERARDLAACGAASSTRSRAEYPTSTVERHARRQRRDAARQRARAVRRDRDREHVRRHPLRPRRRDDRRARPGAVGEPRRRPGRASSSPSTARRPTSRARGSRIRRGCSARRRCCSSTGSGGRTRRRRSTRRSSARSSTTPTRRPRRHGDDGRVRGRCRRRPGAHVSGSWIDGAEGLEQPIVSAVTHSENEVVFDLTGAARPARDRRGHLRGGRRRGGQRGHDPAGRRPRLGDRVLLGPRRRGRRDAPRCSTGAHEAIGLFDVVEIADLARSRSSAPACALTPA